MTDKNIKNMMADKQLSCSRVNAGKTHLKQNQAGMTLLEVIVAMFVLAIGVLALLATQLRSVSGVREAESQTIVAQAVQNLIEGMLINPTLSAATGGSGEATGWTLKNYDNYVEAGPAANCTPQFGNAMSKGDLATAQLCQFKNNLAVALPEGSVRYAVCRDASDAEPTINGGSVNFNCSGNGNNFVVKVVWQMDTEENNTASLIMNGSRAVYTYQARVTE